jgi:hypothetical protein
MSAQRSEKPAACRGSITDKQAHHPSRVAKLMDGSVPRWVRIYDLPDTGDRYTAVYTRRSASERWYPYRAMSSNPFHPQGIGMCGSVQGGPCDTLRNKKSVAWPPAMGRKCHLGKRILFTELPAACQLLVMQDYIDIWKLPKKLLERFQSQYQGI